MYVYVSSEKLISHLIIFFLEKAFPPNMIIMTPRVLCQKLETVKTRIEKLEAAGISYTSLWVVCRSQSEFDEFVDRWKTTSS